MNRTVQVALMVKEGKSTCQIGIELGVSPNTIRYWMKKLGLKAKMPPVGFRQPTNDLTGQRFGHQVVLRMVQVGKSGEWRALCQCDCGSSPREIHRAALVRGASTSCGCRREQYEKIKGKNSSRYTGYEEISGAVWAHIARRSKKNKKYEVLITIQEAWELFLAQDRRCALSGLLLTFGRTEYPRETTASLDRIDSSRSYEKGNVQWTHKKVNLMKGILSNSEFKRFCQLVAQNSIADRN